MAISGRRRWIALAAAGLTVAVGTPVAIAQNGSHETRASVGGDRTQQLRQAVKGGKARNVILFIGDGMGDSEITAARNYARGAGCRLSMDGFPLTGSYTTNSVQKDDPSTPDYVTDSAASGTGWATGTKTYNGAISVDAHGNPAPSILELAKRNGYRTGDVSTAEVQDATPGVLGAHVTDRDCKGPDETTKSCPSNAKENGGAGSIAEQLVRTRPDVLLGGGAAYFTQRMKAGAHAGRTVRDHAKTAGYRIAENTAQLREAPQNEPLLGLFAKHDMATQWTGPGARVGGTEPSKCAPNSRRPADQPRLADMTRKAIGNLDRERGKGFFLQVEGASIDKQDHAADPCGQIGETVGFDDAVAAGRAYARSHRDTLVLVSADHGHTSQIIPNDAHSPGQTATLVTKDGAPMTINYATNTPGSAQQHTGTQVRIAGRGPQAANITGLTDQTDLFGTIRSALALR